MKDEEKQPKKFFTPIIGFETLAANVARARKQMQGRQASREQLAALWEQKSYSGGFGESCRAAIDFGLLVSPDHGQTFATTDLGFELSLAEPKSEEWFKVAARAIRSSEAMSHLLDVFGPDATRTQLSLYINKVMKLKQFRMDRFISVFLRAAQIVERAEKGDEKLDSQAAD